MGCACRRGQSVWAVDKLVLPKLHHVLVSFDDLTINIHIMPVDVREQKMNENLPQTSQIKRRLVQKAHTQTCTPTKKNQTIQRFYWTINICSLTCKGQTDRFVWSLLRSYSCFRHVRLKTIINDNPLQMNMNEFMHMRWLLPRTGFFNISFDSFEGNNPPWRQETLVFYTFILPEVNNPFGIRLTAALPGILKRYHLPFRPQNVWVNGAGRLLNLLPCLRPVSSSQSNRIKIKTKTG